MKALVACEMPEFAVAELRTLGLDVTLEPDPTAEKLKERIADVAILIVGPTRVCPEVISTGAALQMIVRFGADVTNIAVEEASTQGIFVTHCPEKDAAAIAEMTFGLLLALDRRIVENSSALRDSRIKSDVPADARGLAGRTLGIVGCGEVGRQIAHRARAFAMRVLAWSPMLTPEQEDRLDVEFCTWPRELVRKSDLVTVHTSPESDDELLVDAEFLESMRQGAYLVYVGHSAAIDQAALADAVERRGLRVALDVHAAEPGSETARIKSRLLQLPGVIATRHLGSATEQARHATAAAVVDTVRKFLVTGEVVNCVNLCERSPATWQLVLRLRDAVGVLASIMDVVRSDGINAEEIASRVFVGARAAWCTICLDERPSVDALEAIRRLEGVLHLELRAVV